MHSNKEVLSSNLVADQLCVLQEAWTLDKMFVLGKHTLWRFVFCFVSVMDMLRSSYSTFFQKHGKLCW